MSGQSIIVLTDTAAVHISEILSRHKDSVGFRLSVKKTGCSGYMYAPEIVKKAGEGDIRIDMEQGITMFIDHEWVPILTGTIIDLIKEDLGQKKLIYKNPNVDDECGCGESFNIKK